MDPGGDKDLFYVHEVYQNRQAFEEHKKGECFKEWSSGDQMVFRDPEKVIFESEF